MSDLSSISNTAPQIVTQNDRYIRNLKPAFRGQLTAATTTLYTAPAGNSTPTGTPLATALVKSIIVCNTDASARTFTLYGVESGGTAAANRALFSAVTLAAGQTSEYLYPDDTFPLGPSETIQGLASVTLVVTVRINVIELT